MQAILNAVMAIPSTPTLTNFYLTSSNGPFSTTASERLQGLIDHLGRTASGDLILVGEAAGYQGARQSGVAFTSAPMIGLAGASEPSARAVHALLNEVGLRNRTLLWNALPLHPHKPGDVFSNRTPLVRERRLGLAALKHAIAGRQVVCVGNNAEASIQELLGLPVPGAANAGKGSPAIRVRHPSYGGGPQFREETIRALEIWGVI